MSTQDQHESIYHRSRAVWHIVMGCILLGISFLVLKYRSFGNITLDPPAVAYALGGLLIVYGLFRIWRGYAEVKEARNEKMRRDTEDIGK